jgi:hypothetical protein
MLIMSYFREEYLNKCGVDGNAKRKEGGDAKFATVVVGVRKEMSESAGPN